MLHLRKPVLALVAICVSIAGGGCASDIANRYYGTEKYPSKNINDVQLLDKPPDRPYEVIADLQSRGESPQDMRRKAAELGADAVIVTTLGDYAYSEGDEWMQQKNAAVTYARIVGTAIRFRQK